MVESAQGCLSCSGEISTFKEGVYDTRFGIDGHFDICKCKACSLVQLSSRPSASTLRRLYEKYYNFGESKKDFYVQIRTAFFLSPLYRLWMAVDGDPSFHSCHWYGRLLDVGCNEGRGLKIYQQNGFETEGQEINERAAIEARKSGFRVYTELLEDFQPKEPYDIVVLSNVLEHSLQPKNMLKHVARILKPGGQVWISCPNFDSWQRSFFGRYWINWHVPFHIVHFTRDVLVRILQESGFEIKEEQQESPALWVAQSIIARLFAMPGRPTKQLRNPFLVACMTFLIKVLLFPMLWLGNRVGRGDCLIVVAKKI